MFLLSLPCRLCGLAVLTLRRHPICRHCAAEIAAADPSRIYL
jgi:hypothetical protein